MKALLFIAAILFAFAACDTPNGAIGTPEGTTNTSGTTGSANMTNGSPVVKTTPGTAGDTTLPRKDSIPK